jgi:hypothetical protein
MAPIPTPGLNTCLFPVPPAAEWDCGCSLATSALLDRPIVCAGGVLTTEQAAVTITSPGVTFDLGLYTIDGTAETEDATLGVQVYSSISTEPDVKNVHIRNGIILGFETGIGLTTGEYDRGIDDVPDDLPTFYVTNVLLDAQTSAGIAFSNEDSENRLFADRVTWQNYGDEVPSIDATTSGYLSVTNSLFRLNNADGCIEDSVGVIAGEIVNLVATGNLFEKSRRDIYINDLDDNSDLSAKGILATTVTGNCFRAGDGIMTVTYSSRGVVIDNSIAALHTLTDNFFQYLEVAV